MEAGKKYAYFNSLSPTKVEFVSGVDEKAEFDIVAPREGTRTKIYDATFDISSLRFIQVKNKKRWSQVMYMSYVLDYKQRLFNGMNKSRYHYNLLKSNKTPSVT